MKLVLVVLAVLAVMASASKQLAPESVPGSFLVVQGKCIEPISCRQMALDLMHVVGIEHHHICHITPIVDQPTAMSWERHHAYDAKLNVYYLITSYQPSHKVPAVLNLYAVNVATANVTSVQLDSSQLSTLSNIQIDQSTGKIYGLYEHVLAEICPETGAVTPLGTVLGNGYVVARASSFDPASGRYFSYVYDSEHDQFQLATINVGAANGTATLSGPIGRAKDFVLEIVQYLAYNPVKKNVVAAVTCRMGSALIEIDPVAGTWSQLMSYDDPELQAFDFTPSNNVRADEAVFDAQDQVYYVNANQQQLVAVNVDKKQVYYPFGLSYDASNYVFVHN